MTAVALLCVGSAVCVAIAVVVRVLLRRRKRKRSPVAVSLGYTALWVVEGEHAPQRCELPYVQHAVTGHHVALVRRER